MICCCFFLLTLCKDVLFFSCLAISAPRYQDFKVSWVGVWLGRWTLCKPVDLVDVGFRIRAIWTARNRNLPLNPTSVPSFSWKSTMGIFFLSEPVCKPLEKILSKYVQLDQAGFVLKREFIRKYSENNKHHWKFLGSCPWIYEFIF